ncbi:hypothetical protein [Thermodesulfovibrio sp.]|uniref:hypothetical protein n=1 Tax=Thermodesulfovibrio sp. TaxID=2067987 RepID=UPI003099F018
MVERYPDWAVTGLFYSALHLVEAFLAKKGIHPEDHKTRLSFIERVKDLKPVFSNYRALYDCSVNARYRMYKFSSEEVQNIYENYFLPLKKLLKDNKKAP